ncbi:phosphoglycolate phosphatase [Maritimibacter sp. DP1N21-5]|uniref:phosphoglycolate phosphatase n=1 Tax=Maritimibacter sp. DP1N21-5 TaxID=2836867 RepID=UPI001C46A8B2|nr:phosphoglycolate phosphatase [Maritimibacter sp. DP1N21-5]MBV7409690.1 phosphoglycolate phosphatase [Maritimibacter sp. DP1N21-5]
MSPIVFDLDGTLVHSAPDIRTAVNDVLARHGVAPFSLAEIIGFIGNGLPKLTERVIAARGLTLTFAPFHAEIATAYDRENGAKTRPFPGVLEALEALRAAGHPLGICTNKPFAPARDLLARLGIDGYFDGVIGGDSLTTRKPDPAPLAKTFADLGGTGLYVGDSEIDAQTAQSLGVPFLLFAEGYRKAPVTGIPHTAAFTDWSALPGLVADVLAYG